MRGRSSHRVRAGSSLKREVVATRPVVATSYAYVNPILAVLIGAVLSGEPLGATTLIANALIVVAVFLVLRRPPVVKRP